MVEVIHFPKLCLCHERPLVFETSSGAPILPVCRVTGDRAPKSYDELIARMKVEMEDSNES